MGLLDDYRAKLKGLLGGMPITQMAQGRAEVSPQGLLGALKAMPVFDPQSGAQDAFNAGLMALSANHAKKGGEVAESNGYFYRGGQFLPSTDLPPGTWKINGKKVKTGRAQIEPDLWEVQPSPLSRPIYELIRWALERGPGGSLKLRHGLFDDTGTVPITGNSPVRPGVKGYLGKTQYTMQELIDQYNKGSRWIDVDVDLPPELIQRGTK